MEKKYYYIKVSDDFFRRKEVKKLRQTAGGDTYTIILQKLMLLSLKDNGILYYDGIEPTFADELALQIDEDPENVKMTVIYMLNTGLMEEIDESSMKVGIAEEMTGSETDVARRVRKHREKKKLEETGRKALHCNADVTKCNTPVTKCNVIKEIELEKEIEIKKDIHVSDDTRANPDFLKDQWNNICISEPKVKVLSDDRKRKIRQRLNTFTEDDLLEAFRKIEESDFLSGRTKEWHATFDWLFKNDNNVLKVLEGNYDNRKSTNPFLELAAKWEAEGESSE